VLQSAFEIVIENLYSTTSRKLVTGAPLKTSCNRIPQAHCPPKPKKTAETTDVCTHIIYVQSCSSTTRFSNVSLISHQDMDEDSNSGIRGVKVWSNPIQAPKNQTFDYGYTYAFRTLYSCAIQTLICNTSYISNLF